MCGFCKKYLNVIDGKTWKIKNRWKGYPFWKHLSEDLRLGCDKVWVKRDEGGKRHFLFLPFTWLKIRGNLHMTKKDPLIASLSTSFVGCPPLDEIRSIPDTKRLKCLQDLQNRRSCCGKNSKILFRLSSWKSNEDRIKT